MKYLYIVLITLLFIPASAEALTIGVPTNFLSLNSGLVGWWTFDGKDIVNGSVRDKSGQGNHGSPVNISTSTFYTQGKIGQGLNFDGVDDVIATSHNSNQLLTSGGTFSAWIYPKSDGGSDGGRIIDKATDTAGAGGYVFYLTANRLRMQINLSTSQYSAVNSAPYNKWTHAVVTFNSEGLVTFYVNGTVSGTPNIANDPTGITTTAPLCIGNLSGASSCRTVRAWDGTLDDVRIYNRALSAQEVQQLYNMGAAAKVGTAAAVPSSPLSNGLVGHWTFDGKDIINGSVRDKSGQGNHGSPVNISTSTFYTQGKIGQGLNFDGVNDVVTNIGNSGSYSFTTGDFSIGAWVKTNQSKSVLTHARGDNSYGRYALFSDRAVVYTGSVYITASSSTAIDNKYHYIVGRFSRSTNDISFYVDGVLKDSVYWDGIMMNVSGNYVTIGAKYRINTVDYQNFLNGTLDDVRIYNRALSAQEVLQLYNMGAAAKVGTATAVPSSPLSNGLVGHWTFDGKDIINGSVRDTSGQGNHGSPVNISTSTFYAPGKIGQGLNFDGVNDYVSIPNIPAISDSLTLSQWVRFTDTSTIFIQALMGGTSGSLQIVPGNTTSLQIRDDAMTSITVNLSTTFVANRWYLVTVRRDSSDNVKVFINGVDATSGTYSHSGTFTFARIGQRGNNQIPFLGLIDDVRIYNRALSAQEVLQLYLMGR